MLSVLSQYSLMEQQTTERPFKAYPRTPVTIPSQTYSGTIPSSFYNAYPSTTHNSMSRHDSFMPMSVNTQMSATHTTSLAGQGPTHPSQQNQQSLRDMQSRMSCFQNNMQLNPTYMDISGNFKKESEDSAALGGPVGQEIPIPSGSVSTSADSTSKAQNAELDVLKDTQAGNCSDGSSSAEGDMSGIMVPPKKRPHSSVVDDHMAMRHMEPSNLTEEMKDGGYWEKRKKNNESAKRSRDARRMKEEQIALRVVYLEQENLQLRTEVSLLRSEIEKLRCMLYNG
ncbi:transcription factor VBP-like [Lineus longissimus]|uniref:transcription factor VBP-like n=1 Tax=Lineus longissimus TaxID=88925 RepID=UPI00315D5EE9